MNDLTAQIQAILYWRGEPVTVGELAKLVESDAEGVREALSNLDSHLAESGLTLVRKSSGEAQSKKDEVALTTAPEEAERINKIMKSEINRDLTAAELETLTIILYYGPVSKADIDYIRGVNAGTILRKLQVRGLVEKQPDPERARGVLYAPTTETLTHLGIAQLEELPEYEEVRDTLGAFADPEADDSTNPFTTKETTEETPE